MKRKQLISLLEQSAAWEHERTRFCPDDETIAGYVDGSLAATERDTVEHHLAECSACVQRIGFTTRLLREAETESPRRPALLDPRWAVAASVLLAVTWLAWAPIEDPGDIRETRSIESQLAQPEILAPSSGVLLSKDNLVVRWTDVPGRLYYEVRIVTDAGDLLSVQRVEDTKWRIGEDIDLQPGREYFIRVDAYLSESQAIQSEHIPFRLQE